MNELALSESPDAPPLSVRRVGIGVFLVRSERPACKDWYQVSLSEPGFPHGHCSCIDFGVRIEPFLCRGQEPERATCKHCDRVRAELENARVLCEQAGLQFSESIIPPPTPPPTP